MIAVFFTDSTFDQDHQDRNEGELNENDDITYFQFTKKNNREEGPAVVGVELKYSSDLDSMEQKMKTKKINYQHLNEQKELFTHLIF